MDINEKEKMKKQYFKLLKHLGWKVAYDADSDCENQLYDLLLFLTRVGENKRTEYGFLKEAYTSNLSLEAFHNAFANATTGEYAKFTDTLDSRIYPFDINDVIAQCLHLGLSIETFYHLNAKGRLALELDPDLINQLIDMFVMRNSPLVNLAEANKPKKLKKRSKTYLNLNPQIPQDVLRE
jgi:hypothetical protein